MHGGQKRFYPLPISSTQQASLECWAAVKAGYGLKYIESPNFVRPDDGKNQMLALAPFRRRKMLALLKVNETIGERKRRKRNYRSSASAAEWTDEEVRRRERCESGGESGDQEICESGGESGDQEI